VQQPQRNVSNEFFGKMKKNYDIEHFLNGFPKLLFCNNVSPLNRITILHKTKFWSKNMFNIIR